MCAFAQDPQETESSKALYNSDDETDYGMAGDMEVNNTDLPR